MEWRCEWCGKPHAENDPPCDNCGHGTFEKAVVPQAASPDEGGRKTTVWVCPECGRAHPKNSPPCSRCGHHKLEMEERSVDDYGDVGAPSYRDLITTRYAVGLVAALALAAVFVLGVTGIVAIPGLTPPGLEISGVPGNATVAEGIDLDAAEETYLDLLNDRRQEARLQALSSDRTLDEVTTFFHQRSLKEEFTDDELPSVDPAAERLGDTCSAEPGIWSVSPGDLPTIEDVDSAAVLAGMLADRSIYGSRALDEGWSGKTGVDIHVGPNGRIHVLQLVC